MIGGSLVRKDGVPFLVSDVECLQREWRECQSFGADLNSSLSASDEKGKCDPWTTCTLSLRGGAVKLECNRDTKSKTNSERAMTVALPPNVGPIAFVVRENFNDPLRIVGGAMPAPARVLTSPLLAPAWPCVVAAAAAASTRASGGGSPAGLSSRGCNAQPAYEPSS